MYLGDLYSFPDCMTFLRIYIYSITETATPFTAKTDVVLNSTPFDIFTGLCKVTLSFVVSLTDSIAISAKKRAGLSLVGEGVSKY